MMNEFSSIRIQFDSVHVPRLALGPLAKVEQALLTGEAGLCAQPLDEVRYWPDIRFGLAEREQLVHIAIARLLEPEDVLDLVVPSLGALHLLGFRAAAIVGLRLFRMVRGRVSISG